LGKAFLNMTPHQRSGVDYLLESIGEEEFWYDIYKSHFPREIQLKDGEHEMWVEFSYSPVVRDRRVEEILVVAGDITERVRSRRIKESHDQLEGKYASIFSEIRTAEPRTLSLAVIDIEHQLEIMDAMNAKDLGNPSLVLPPLHSIKGTARSAGLTYITSMAHTAEDEVISSRDEKAPPAEIYAIVHRYHKDFHETWDIVKSIMRIVHPDLVESSSEVPKEVVSHLDEALSILKEESGTPEKRLAKVRDILEKTSQAARGLNKSEGTIDLREVEPRLRSLISKTAEACKKKIDVSVKMDEVLLPKDVFAKVSEMATHLLSNAVDHGIEDLEGRRKANKEESGKVRIFVKVADSGQAFTLTIEDDGNGVDEKKIVERAITMGLITKEESPQYLKNKDAAFSLMMRQGFSTREVETEVSGRGVGLDVADRLAKELSVSGEGLKVRSALGYGTVFTVDCKIPNAERNLQKKAS
jgi:chemotaxis protein histidine kinase CheA